MNQLLCRWNRRSDFLEGSCTTPDLSDDEHEMLDAFLQLLPGEPGSIALFIAMAGSLIGAALWIGGATFSRPLITLLTVLVGAVVGMHFPVWFGWNVSGAGPAMLGALVLGVSGFALHRMWVGVGLGSILAAWAAFIVWICLHDGGTWVWPAFDGATMTPFGYLRTVYDQLPANIGKALPYACAIAMVIGVAASILWPKLTTVLNWSGIGVSMLAGMGIAAIAFGKPELLRHVPAQTWAQSAVLATLIAVGAAVQWKLAPVGLFEETLNAGSISTGKKKEPKKK
jgi:hypothetical protein